MGDAAPFSPSRGGNRPARPGFSLLSPAFLDELRARLTLSTIVGRTVRLKKAGNEWKACCPFHQEKTPSFWVNDDKAFYHCFGCGAHGDAIKFVTETQGLSFIDAVKELAQAAGMEMPTVDPATRERHERALGLADVVEQAAGVFEKSFRQIEGAAARDYAAKRGLSAETIAAFRIGFAPDARNRIKAAMPDVDVKLLIDSGLLIDVDGKDPYDRFRGRLMVPIRDPRGRVIAFGGRVIGDGEPKYLNSPETPLFDKGRTLFNLDRAGPAARRSGRLFVVEGYLDAIALDQAGLRETVAPLGTALTEDQLALLWRAVDTPTLCFDGDGAGAKAAVRAAERALAQLRSGKGLAVALLPKGQDPDDLIRTGGLPAFEAVADAALPLGEFLYRKAAGEIDPSDPDQRIGLRTRLDALAETCEDRIVREEYARFFKGRFYDDFGWKKADRQEIKALIVRTADRHSDVIAGNLALKSIRSLLIGLTRMPAVARDHLEAIDRIPIAHRDLARWRNRLVDLVGAGPALDGDGIEAILESEFLPEVQLWDLTVDLRFGFTRPIEDGERAAGQLAALIAMLSQETALVEELDGLDRDAVSDAGGDRYAAIEGRRRQVRDARAALHEEGSVWSREDE